MTEETLIIVFGMIGEFLIGFYLGVVYMKKESKQ